MNGKITSHIVKGSIISLLLILIDITGHLTNWVFEDWFSWIGIFIFIAGIMGSIIYFGRQMNNQVTFGQSFTHGFKTASVVICIVFVYTWLSIYFLFPAFMEIKMGPGLIQAKLHGKTDLEINDFLANAKKVFLAGNLMFNLVTGAAGSVLGSIVTKRNAEYNLTTINK